MFDSASESLCQKIQSIQTQALRYCCGAMRSTAAVALQVECGERPLKLRRLAQQIKFAVKATASDQYPAGRWTTAYGKYNDRKKLLASKVTEYFEQRSDETKWRGPLGQKYRRGRFSGRPSTSSSLRRSVSKNNRVRWRLWPGDALQRTASACKYTPTRRRHLMAELASAVTWWRQPTAGKCRSRCASLITSAFMRERWLPFGSLTNTFVN